MLDWRRKEWPLQHIELNYSDINAGANLGPKREPTM
jgi:hypothetical protein